jgi:hypothetical protein
MDPPLDNGRGGSGVTSAIVSATQATTIMSRP